MLINRSEDHENLWDDDVYRTNDLSPDPPERIERFINFISDIATATVCLLVFLYFLGWLMSISGRWPRFIEGMSLQLMWLIIYFMYLFFTEFALRGKTIGKYITNTRVVGMNGQNASFFQLFLRCLIRIVPMEPLSIFIGKNNNTWHDQWSRTKVIKEVRKPHLSGKDNVILD